jgi:hypothetical protein
MAPVFLRLPRCVEFQSQEVRPQTIVVGGVCNPFVWYGLRPIFEVARSADERVQVP